MSPARLHRPASLSRRRLACSVAVGALAHTPALAADLDIAPRIEEPTGVEEIVVTARRREENLQDVPVAVTAVTARALERQDLRTASDMERSIPALSLCCGRGQASSPFLRGVPGVIGYFAEVPAPLDGGGQFFDVSGVQVLKGPQGTLFGLSTNGGAVVIEPNASESAFGGRLSGVVGSRQRATLEGVVNVPLGETLSARVGVQLHKADGYVEDVRTGRDLGEDSWWVGRVSLAWRPTDEIASTTIVDYWRSTGRPYPAIVRAIDPNGLFRRVFGAAAADAFLAQQQALGPYKVPGLFTSDPERDDRQLKLINRTTWEITPDLTLKNVAGYTETTSFSAYDRAGTPYPLLAVNAAPTEKPNPVKQYSEELQLSGKAFDRKLTFVLGSFNLWSEQDPTLGYNITLGAPSGTRSATEARTNALYFEGEYDLSGLIPGLKAVGGYRYTWDKRKASQQRVSAAGAVLQSFSGEDEWSAASYRLGLQYALGERTQVYFTNSRGYSSGGFNLTAPESLRTFDPESLDNYEIGLKSDWTAGPVSGRINLAAYFGKYSDIQVPVTSRVDTPAGPVVAVVTQNAAQGEVKGVEGEFVLIPTPSLELSGNFSWMDARYTRYQGLDPTGAKVVDLSNTAFVYVPKWKYTLAARYTLPIPGHFGLVQAAADYTWQDEVVTGARPKPVPFYYIRPDFETLNLSLTWRDVMGQSGIDATAFATNVTENSLSNGGFNVYDVLGLWALNVAEPRSFGLRLTYSF